MSVTPISSQSSTSLTDVMIKDLAASGLTPEDVFARRIGNGERAATITPHSIDGYVLPYFEPSGKIQPFYRVRLFDSDVKYRQIKDAPNHVYYPRLFKKALQNKSYIIFTEGEKKAALSCKLGFPCVAFGGVDSWKNRTILISGDAALTQHKGKLVAKLPASEEPVEDYNTNLATGLMELIDFIVARKLTVIIIYDSDSNGETKSEVQRAAATLGFELRYRGVPFKNIRQLILPPLDDAPDKTGLDDFLMQEGPEEFTPLLTATLSRRAAFPTHPNVRDYISRRLQKSMIGRKEYQQVSISILADLDSKGIRLRSKHGANYYFDFGTKKLIPTYWPGGPKEQFDAPFTQFLYKAYGLSTNDQKLLNWLGTQFTAEEPIEEVTPQKIIALDQESPDKLYYQVSDSEFVEVSADGFEFRHNGDRNVLFEANQVEPLNIVKLKEEIGRQRRNRDTPFWWGDTLQSVRLKDPIKQRTVAALLYYLSPWLFRWRGMQLPVELFIGESGSGKSTLCQLRLDIISGRSLLRNAPHDIKDWHSSIVNAGGLHVTDNVAFTDKFLRQAISDELCRIVTEPEPFVEQRRYYTNADQVRFPVRAVFALTAIQMPFVNMDIMQRSFKLEFDKMEASDSGELKYDSFWKERQLQHHNGREGWIAHHLVVLCRFFQTVRRKWNPNYSARHRLVHFEQALMLMAETLNVQNDWIPEFIVSQIERDISSNDWALEGLEAFAQAHSAIDYRGKRFACGTISEWASEQEDFKKCDVLTNPRKLGRYIAAHKSVVYMASGIKEAGNYGNKTVYMFDPKKQPGTSQPLGG